MGKRRESRTPIELPVRIFGTDHSGKIFSENVTTIDVSQHGARLRGQFYCGMTYRTVCG